MEVKRKIKKFFKNKIVRIVALALIVLVIIFLITYNPKEDLDTTYIIAKLEKASELTTAKLTYNGFSKYTDNGITIINKADFLMVYTATARAGIDIKEVKVTSNNITKTVLISIPKAKILEVKVDPKSIKYYDEKFALFNFDAKEDANKAQAMAEDKAKEDLKSMGILEMADSQSEALIKGIIQDLIPQGYKLKIEKQ